MTSHDADDGRWQMIQAQPHPALLGLVTRYATYEEAAPAPVVRRVLPAPEVAVIINLGPAWEMRDPTTGASLGSLGSFAAGIHDSFGFVGSAGVARCMQVDFSPLGAFRFFGVPMHELASTTTSLQELVGDQSRILDDRLRSASDWEEAFCVLDRFILGRMAGTRMPSPEVVWAWEKLERSAGAVRVQELATELGWSRKRLRSRFREEVGAPAKVIAQLLRFNAALAGIHGIPGDAGMAGLALGGGYADQAHMAREFRRFSGWSPTEYRRGFDPGEPGFVEP